MYMNTTIAPNHLIILGNGFDLAHGLKTSYADFIRAMILDNYKTEKEYSDNPFYLLYFDRFNPPRTFPKYYNATNKELLELYLFDVGEEVNYSSFLKNLLYDFFDKGWVDLEEAYFRELGRWKDEREKIVALNKVMEALAVSLEQYLIQVGAEECECNDFIARHFYFMAGGDISSRLSLRSLSKEVDKLKVPTKFKEEIEKTIQGYQRERREIKVLNFNYTNTIGNYIAQKTGFASRVSDRQVINIHGKLGEGNLILGYGDEASDLYKELENANDNELTKYFKSFYYAQSEQYRDLFAFLDSGEFRVHLMGHSCGLSDRVLLSAIFQHTNLEAVKLYYHDKGNGTDDFLERTQNISRHFKDKHRFRLKLLPKKNKAKKGVVNTNYSVPLVKQDDN